MRFLVLFVLVITQLNLAMAEDPRGLFKDLTILKDDNKKLIDSNAAQLLIINKSLKDKNLKNKKELQDKKNKLVTEKIRLKYLSKYLKNQGRLSDLKKNLKIDVNISQKKICQSPCEVTIEAKTSKLNQKNIEEYIFYVNKKKIVSSVSKIKTTLVFNKKSTTPLKIPYFKMFKIHAEVKTKEDRYFKSKRKGIVVKSGNQENLKVTLISSKVMPMDFIRISYNGPETELNAAIDGNQITFKRLTDPENSDQMEFFLPYLNKSSVNLKILNQEFKIDILPLTQVSQPDIFLTDFNNSILDFHNSILANSKVIGSLSPKATDYLTSVRNIIEKLNLYIERNKNSQEVQLMANLLNAYYLSNPESNIQAKSNNTKSRFVINSSNFHKALTGFSTILISEARAAEETSELPQLSEELFSMLGRIVTEPASVIFDGMINKCYIEKGRNIPVAALLLEEAANKYVQDSAISIIRIYLTSGTLAAAETVTFLKAIGAIDAYIIFIGKDCEGNDYIDPVLKILSQPNSEKKYPETALNYDVKCDVGNPRYYNPSSLLTNKTSKFDYISDEYDNEGEIVKVEKLLKKSTGLGKFFLEENHPIKSSTNNLIETQFYQLNKNQFEVFNKESCNGTSSYTVGGYLTINPIMSCDFVNESNNVGIIGEDTFANIITIDLHKTFYCPKAVLYTKVTGFKLQVAADDSFNAPMINLTYEWDFGDGTKETSITPNHNHIYKGVGEYLVTVTVRDPSGGVAQKSKMIKIEPKEVTLSFNVNPAGTYLFTDPMTTNDLGDYYCTDSFLRQGCVGVQPPTRIYLSQFYNNPSLHFKPGDSVYIHASGTFQNGSSFFGGQDIYKGLGGVIGGGGGYMYPGSDWDFWPYSSPPTFAGVSTDIPYDFDISEEGDMVQIPVGAEYIEFTASDVNFASNSDPNGDFKVHITFLIYTSN